METHLERGPRVAAGAKLEALVGLRALFFRHPPAPDLERRCGAPPRETEVLYSVYSTSVHTNPVTVISGSSEAELARLDSAHGAIATTVAIYGRAWIQFASWCGVPYPGGALENIFAVLREGAASDRQ